MAAQPGISATAAPPNAVVQVQPGVNVQPVVLVDQYGNYVTASTANALATTTAPVSVSAATAPTSGQVLTATSATAATWQAAFVNPMTTPGDTLYEASGPVIARLAGNTTATKNFYTQTGSGSASAAPAWAVIAAGDLPTGTTSAKGALQLDGTAGDIQPLGTQAAGAVGMPSDAGHVHAQIPLSTQPADVGYQAWNFDPLFTTLSVTFTSLPVAGDRYLARIDVHSAITVSAVWAFWLKPSGGSPADNFLALYSSSGAQVGSTTPDFTTTATGLQGFSLGGSQNLAIGVYYVAYLCGTQGGTPGGLAYSSQATSNVGGVTSAWLYGDSGHTAAKYRFAVNGTGASALPGSFTLSSNGVGSVYPFWCALA